MPDAVDLIFFNGKILTVDAQFSVCQALAVSAERIVAVGTNEDILPLAGNRTRRIDLGGRTIIPGLIDAHPHIDSWKGFYRSLSGCTSITEVVGRVATAVSETGTGKWIMFQKFAEPDSKAPANYQEGRFPNRHDLDSVSPNNPVWLRGGYLTPNVLNSAALELAGITRDTPQPRQLVPVVDWRTGDTVASPRRLDREGPGHG